MKAVITKIKDETYDTKIFRIKPEVKIDFKPGQFFMLGAKINNETIKRAYSASSSPFKDYIDFTVKLRKDGLFTNYLFKAKVGDILMLDGPYGKFTFDDDSCKRVVLIGAGCGVAPLRGILHYILEKKLKTKIDIFFYFKTKNDIVYRKELEKLKDVNINISLTREEWPGLKGRVSEDHLQSVLKNDEKLFFISGSSNFGESAKKLLIDNGIDLKYIKSEAYG